MTLRYYLILMGIGTLLCWLAWGFVIWSIDPETTGLLGASFFYSTFFMAMVGTFSVIGFMIRQRIFKNDDIVFRQVKRTFRQSMILASLLIGTLILLHVGLLRWWNGVLLILFGLVIEGIIFTNRKFSNPPYVR